jgi:histidinol-phosphate aminotransferase
MSIATPTPSITKATSTLQLQYGINVYAETLYRDYQPLRSTVNYPDPLATDLRQDIAAYAGVAPEMILCGSGSDELIDIYIRLHQLTMSDLHVAIAPPTFYSYDTYTRRMGATVINLPWDRSRLTPELLSRHGGDPAHTIVILDSPSNPAGDMVSRRQFRALLDAGYHVFADEAYFEFAGQTVLDYLPLYPRQLVVSRTFSKIGGMAGSRVGYVIAHPELIANLRTHKLMFNVNLEGQHRARYVLGHMDQFRAALTTMREARDATAAAIAKLDTYELYDSLPMYLIVRHRRLPSVQLHRRLRDEHHIETHLFPGFKGHEVVRITVGHEPELKRVVDALSCIINP